MKSLKELAQDILAARSNLLNKEDDVRRAKLAYIEAEKAYLNIASDRMTPGAVVVDCVAISISGMWPDSRDGEHLEFENVEVLS